MISLAGKKGLVIGIANKHSIAWVCAKAFYNTGVELVATYLNDSAKPYVWPLAKQINVTVMLPLDMQGKAQYITGNISRIDAGLHVLEN